MDATMNGTISVELLKLVAVVGEGGLYNHGYYVFFVAAICMLGIKYVLKTILDAYFGVKAPVVGFRSIIEPAWLVGLRFGRQAGPMSKDSFFKVQRNEGQILILPRRYINELRDVSEKKLSAMEAHLKNMVATYTIGNLHMMRNSDLHRRALQRRLTPTLGVLIHSLKQELEYALTMEVPAATKQDWTPLSINELTVRMVARISARVFVGPDLCRDPEWLYLSIHFTKNLGWTRNILRLFPTLVRPVAARLMPSYWRIHTNVAAAQKLLRPIIAQRKQSIAQDPGYEKPNDFLQWMMDDARPDEEDANDIVHRQLLVSLAAIHTTSMSISHFIYDLCAHPQYVQPLRQEIIDILREDNGFKKTTLNKFRKLDSFLKESQRMNPPLVISFQRIVQTNLTLKDGTKLSAGTHLAMASDAISHDPACLPGGGDPEVFDPFRYARLREQDTNTNRYQFATTDESSLHFGHGIFACPGRFFASNEIKLILSHLLILYDFKFQESQSRPKNLCYEEACYPDPAIKILMRGRVVPEQDIEALLRGA